MDRDVTEEYPESRIGYPRADVADRDSTIPAQVGTALLIVDDEPIMTDLIRDLLEPRGYHTLSANCAEEALRLYATHSDCIVMVITDLDMPGMGGAALIEELLHRDPQLRILVVSGICTEGYAQALRGRGVQGFVHKPFLPRQLLRLIQDMLAEPRQRPQGWE